MELQKKWKIIFSIFSICSACAYFIRKKNKKKWYLKFKRIQDVILSLFALIVLFPFLLFIALLIVIDDPHAGPIYKQKRIGKNGKSFYMLKFRSMHKNADKMVDSLEHINEADGPVFKIKDDPRITRVGKWIRKTSIDELPQLINVIKGEMTIVGPRPALPREVKQYKKEYWKRFCVTPGLTCYWQVLPNRHDIPFEEWMALDMKYISKMSFLTDWKLIIETIRVILQMEGV